MNRRWLELAVAFCIGAIAAKLVGFLVFLIALALVGAIGFWKLRD